MIREKAFSRARSVSSPLDRGLDLPREVQLFDASSSVTARVVWLITVFQYDGSEAPRCLRIKERTEQSGKDDGGRTKMPSILNEAFEWLDRAGQAREVAGQLTDPGARKAVLELAQSFDRLARAAATPAVLRRRELANKDHE